MKRPTALIGNSRSSLPLEYVSRTIDQQELIDLPLDRLALHPRFRGHRIFSPADHLDMLRNEMIHLINSGAQIQALFRKGDLMALLALGRSPWDSAHFGVGMGKALLVANPELCPKVLKRFARTTLFDACDLLDVMHWSAEVDMDDYICLNSLLSVGFEIMDVKKTYCAHSVRDTPDHMRLHRSVRPYRQSDFDSVNGLLEKTSFTSRFSRDPHLDRSKVKAMYEIWFRKILGNQDSTANALVFEKNNQVVACGAIDELDLSDIYGKNRKMMSGGLYVSRSDIGVGAYLPIMHRLTSDAILRHGMVETTVSENNASACRVLNTFRSHIVNRYALRLYRPQVDYIKDAEF